MTADEFEHLQRRLSEAVARAAGAVPTHESSESGERCATSVPDSSKLSRGMPASGDMSDSLGKLFRFLESVLGRIFRRFIPGSAFMVSDGEEMNA